MKKVSVKQLSADSFSIYGSYANLLNPDSKAFKFVGENVFEFYRDMVVSSLGPSNEAAFSTCRVFKRQQIIDTSEYHNFCGETIIPMDGDILMHVAPATGGDEVPVDMLEVFYIPKGTVVSIRPGVWHHAAFPAGCDSVNIVCILPERTYANDCHVVTIPEEQRIEVVDNP